MAVHHLLGGPETETRVQPIPILLYRKAPKLQ